MFKDPIHSIDYEMADRITISNLKDTMNFLVKKNEKLVQKAGEYDLSESNEFVKNNNLIECFKAVLKHYGEIV
jgi:hypothetical protein